MATYDVEARIEIAKTSNKKQLYQRLNADATVTEVTAYDPYVVPNSASDLAIPLGSVGTASTLLLETTSTEAISFKLNGSGNTALSLTNGFAFFTGVTITSLHVTVPGSNDVNLTIVAVE
jgi:hypothetical protein